MRFKKNTISVIIPVYNSSAYLNYLFNCLLKQTLQKFTVIFVDDGSADNSYEMCKNFCKMDKNRFKVVSQSNKGPSAARNLGISLVDTEYICFIDSDDEISDFFLERFFMVMNMGYDLAIVNYTSENPTKFFLDSTLRPFNASRLDDLFENKITGYLWDKCFRTDIIKNNNILFDENTKIREDMLFILQYQLHCKDGIKLPDVSYYYRINPKSIVNSDNKRYEDKIYVYSQMSVYLQKIERSNAVKLVAAMCDLSFKYLLKDKVTFYGYKSVKRIISNVKGFGSLIKAFLMKLLIMIYTLKFRKEISNEKN